MELDLIWLALGIAVAGYFIGSGLKNFNNPDTRRFSEILDDTEHELVTENELPDFMGISKEDAYNLVKEHPEVPHIIINDKVYYPRKKLRAWLENLGE